MSRTRVVALGAMAWLLVVGIGAGLVWTVISRAGEEVASKTVPRVADPTPSSTTKVPGTKTPTTRTPTTRTAEPREPSRRSWQGPPGTVATSC